MKFRRVRTTAYAGMKMLELIDGGSIIDESFTQAADLAVFWNEPAQAN